MLAHTNTHPCPDEDTHVILVLVFRYEHEATMKTSTETLSDRHGASTLET